MDSVIEHNVHCQHDAEVSTKTETRNPREREREKEKGVDVCGRDEFVCI